jgi:ATP-dependent helicase/nuclease subunit B
LSLVVVVPGERHVERLARDGIRAETRTALRARLASAFLPDTRFADPRETRLALAMALLPLATKTRPAGKRTAQLDLFGAAASPPTQTSATDPSGAASGDAVLAPLRRRGGASWVRLVESIDSAIGIVRARGGTPEDLERTAAKAGGVTASRARTLADAMRALDEALAAASARDGRLLGRALAEAIASAEPKSVSAVLGASRVRARWLLAWDPSDLAWWRALDDRLARLAGANGWARIAIPSFDRPLEGTRERDPLEILADDVAKGLDAAPEAEPIAMVLGDLAGDAPADAGAAISTSTSTSTGTGNDRLALVRAQDPVAQAQRVADVVRDALSAGARVERIAIATPSLDERTLAPLRRALEDRAVISYEARGAPPSEAPVVAAALLALEVAASLERRLVARLLRSGFVDAGRIAGEDHPRRDAARALERVARALETNATARGSDAGERLVATAALADVDARDGETTLPAKSFARAVVGVLAVAAAPKTRGDHVRAARELWQRLGIGARAGRGGLAAFARDEAPTGVPRAERLAIARDARAWESLVSALDAYENVAHVTKSLDQEIDGEAFRLELASVLDAGAARPGAGRAGAVRIARLADVAGDDLDLLVVIDANEGVLPRDVTQDAIVSDALGEALARASRGAFAPLGGVVARARDLAALATAAADAARVVLTYTIEDGAGSPLAPSPIVDVLLRAGVTLHDSTSAPTHSPAAATAATAEDVARRAHRERTREAFFLDPARPLSDLTADLSHPSVSALVTRETGGADRSLAVTGLERFAKCPFMGFAHVVLAARDAERGEELPDAREEGNLVHEALAAAFSAVAAEWPRRPRAREKIFTEGLAAAEGVLDRAAGHAVLATVVRLRVRDAVAATLARAIDDEVWDFAAAEQKFGARDASSWPAFVLERDGARLALRGSIDRVDRAHDGSQVRVVDYKRSKSTVRDAASGLGETAIQVPLYACVASTRFAVPAKGMYLATQPRDIAEGSATPTAKAERRMDDLVAREAPGVLAEIERRALAIVRSVREGHLAPTPADESLCRTCSVSGGCRKPRFAMAPAEDDDEAAP